MSNNKITLKWFEYSGNYSITLIILGDIFEGELSGGTIIGNF